MLRFEKRAPRAIVWGFHHGRYADAWSILHVLSGLSLGSVGLLTGLPLWLTFTLVISLLFLYELWEAAVEIAEDVQNALSDVAFGLLGFFVMYGFNAMVLHGHYLVLCLAVLLVADAAVLWRGWRSYARHRRAVDHDALLPSLTSKAGRSLIKRDQILFCGFALASMPVMVIAEAAGTFYSGLWLGAGITLSILLYSK